MQVTGEILKERGQQQSLFKSGDDWKSRSLAALSDFCRQRKIAGCAKFMLEEFRVYAESLGIIPDSVNSWGGFPRMAERSRLINCTGTVGKSARVPARARRSLIWEAI